ncbi:MAG: ABC transporter substrate-binding protein [Aggregatilineales bacterium]
MKKILSLVLAFMLVMVGSVVAAQDDEMEGPLVGFWEECATPENLPETVTIGAIFGLSGPIGVYGNPQQQSVQLAVDEINASAYLGEGTTLEVIIEDSNGDAEQAIAAMTKLVEEDGVVAVLGPTLSTEAFAADPIAQENGTVVMGVSNTALGITEMGDFVFRDSLPESAVIPGTISQAVEALGLETVGVLYGNDDDFTISGYEVFMEALEENAVAVLMEETFARGDVDFSAQLTNLIAQEPDAIVASALAAEAIQIINQARDLGFTGPIIGGNGFNSPAVLAQTEGNSEGLIVGAAWNVQNPENNDASVLFTEMFEAANEALPDQFAAQAYTGAWLMATAIRCGDSVDRTDVRDALAVIQEFYSPLGDFSFDDNRDPVHDPVAQIVFEGEFAPLSVIAEMD